MTNVEKIRFRQKREKQTLRQEYCEYLKKEIKKKKVGEILEGDNQPTLVMKGKI